MRTHHCTLFAVITVCLPLHLLVAQAAPTHAKLELGTDATLMRDLENEHAILLRLPGQVLRVGFFASPQLSVESGFNFFFATSEGSHSSQVTFQPGILLNHAGDQTRAQFYVHPFFNLASAHVSYDFSIDGSFHRTVTRTGGGLGVGVRIPVAQRLAARFELQYDQLRSSSEYPGEKDLKFQFGISYLGK